MTTDEAFFKAAVKRMQWLTLWLSGAGAAVGWGIAGWQYGLGFLVGGLASAANFRWLHYFVASLGPDAERSQRGVITLLIIRYTLLLLCGYAIVSFFRLNLAAALMGLLVAAAAVILEILYELIYARA